jgi:glutaredoxin
MSYYINAYILEGCPYSMETKNKLKNKKDINIIIVKQDKEEKNKIKKENNMNTFPQIILVYNNNKYIIGGNDDLKYLLEIKNDVKEMLGKNKLKNYFNSIKNNTNLNDYDVFLMALILIYQ